jgi:hypothetical protein
MPEPRQSSLPREELLHEFLATTELRDPLRQLADAIVHVGGVGSVAGVARTERRRQPVLQLIEAGARPPPGGAEQHGTSQGGTENGKEHGFVVHAHMGELRECSPYGSALAGFQREPCHLQDRALDCLPHRRVHPVRGKGPSHLQLDLLDQFGLSSALSADTGDSEGRSV